MGLDVGSIAVRSVATPAVAAGSPGQR